VFAPQTTGVFVLLIIVLAFTAGAVRGELALILTGAVFLAVWVYCLAMTLLLALICRGRARRVSIRISPREIAAGDRARAVYSEGEDIAPNRGRFRLPGILIRCRIQLSTGDGRHIRHDFEPGRTGKANSLADSKADGKSAGAGPDHAETFAVRGRGAYFSVYDEFAVFDALGFFRFAYHIPQEDAARLLASPRAADEPVPVTARAGESSQKPEFSFQRTDNLIDHRPYVPGDDPRRINWKLYGHGGELFVREGEREPPPHSNLAILIDSQFDPPLFSAADARRGVDLLCETALAAAIACAESGADVRIGCNGGALRGGTAAELAAALAWPAALPLAAGRSKPAARFRLRKPRQPAAPAAAELPAAPEDRGIVIFALPRISAETSALDRFLREHAGRSAGRGAIQTVDLIFICGGNTESGDTAVYGERLAAAEVCVSLYNQRLGVRARIFHVPNQGNTAHTILFGTPGA
jgi:uncharacterized protein (DUF58 family)